MGYLLHVDPDVDMWLADTRERSPDDAKQVDEALDALRQSGAELGPPLVVRVDYRPVNGDMVPELESLCQYLSQALTRVRREAAEAATLRATLERHLDQSLTDDQRERLRSAYDGIRAQETRVTEASRRMTRDVGTFRLRKETLKASCTQALVDGISLVFDARLASGDEDTEPPQLLELRPGAPGRIVARLLFTASPAGVAHVITAATDDDLLRAWYGEVIPAAIPEYGFSSPRTSGASLSGRLQRQRHRVDAPPLVGGRFVPLAGEHVPEVGVAPRAAGLYPDHPVRAVLDQHDRVGGRRLVERRPAAM